MEFSKEKKKGGGQVSKDPCSEGRGGEGEGGETTVIEG